MTGQIPSILYKRPGALCTWLLRIYWSTVGLSCYRLMRDINPHNLSKYHGSNRVSGPKPTV
ncbi:hypothetical protein [Escherichia phage vB_EcoM_Lh1B]|uniref:Uncharacterized protein n=1 Tax=Escherichia phage vB_EcoM_EC001 TaxID=2739754 RepID=A0A7D4V0U7_9CAUD|nr:hypothetical protein ACEC001_0040 [Escherichia phage vB_EcoM_EC001]UGO35727.1 hypothetical protein [Escherichia phage vB_EcoM_Lh1B]